MAKASAPIRFLPNRFSAPSVPSDRDYCYYRKNKAFIWMKTPFACRMMS